MGKCTLVLTSRTHASLVSRESCRSARTFFNLICFGGASIGTCYPHLGL